jgi:hypothetical protein
MQPLPYNEQTPDTGHNSGSGAQSRELFLNTTAEKMHPMAPKVKEETSFGSQWPAADWWLIDKVVTHQTTCLDDLHSSTDGAQRARELTGSEVIDALFPENPILTVGYNSIAYWSLRRKEFRYNDSNLTYIIPNVVGEAEKYLVVRFDIGTEAWRKQAEVWDQEFGISNYDAQSSLLILLTTKGGPRLPLVLVVSTANDQLEGWFKCGENEEINTAFKARAARLGADVSAWDKDRSVAMPGGSYHERKIGELDTTRRTNTVEYFDAGKTTIREVK